MYRWVDHTAEVELEIEAASEREVLEEAVRALAELLGIEGSGDAVRTVSVGAGDRPALLATWIEELVFLAESEGFVATRLDDLDLQAGRLNATVSGVLDAPPPLVKAVTYHRLEFAPRGDGYVARVILDV
ncbi:MAG TPA: archease [Solirubrobacteraceae bacterium]|nr:archease [Solirubrobacteraceae bacterium]